MATQTKPNLSAQLKELAKYRKYNIIKTRLIKAAKSSPANSIAVLKDGMDDAAYERLEAEGLTITFTDYGNYKAFKIGW